MVNGTKILSSKTLKQYETLLEGTNFIRIHHAHLINTIHVKKYIKGEGGHVVMSDGTTVDVSKRKKTEFLNKVNNF